MLIMLMLEVTPAVPAAALSASEGVVLVREDESDPELMVQQ